LTDRDISIWDVDQHHWKVQGGLYQLYIGSSSKDIRAVSSFTITGQAAAQQNKFLSAEA